jgi:hypothetical protein
VLVSSPAVLQGKSEDGMTEIMIRGAGEVMLTTHKRRADAHHFYRSVGYEATGYRFYEEL